MFQKLEELKLESVPSKKLKKFAVLEPVNMFHAKQYQWRHFVPD